MLVIALVKAHVAKLALVLVALLVATGLPPWWGAFVGVIVFASPLALKYAPNQLKGKPMVVAAFAVSSAIGLLAMAVAGDFNHFNLANAVDYLIRLAWLQQTAYALFKDNLNLADH